MADEEGRLPLPFKQQELGAYWAEHCNFDEFLKPDPELQATLMSLRDDGGLKMVAFTNAPREYALRCLDYLGLDCVFSDTHTFAVEDVLPACKPEKAAFETVLSAVGVRPDGAVMFEDSMKNIRACKALGIRTVLINETGGESGDAGLLGDLPCNDDPAVD